jgi:hypothetical protein
MPAKFNTHFDIPPHLRALFQDAPPQLIDMGVRRRRTRSRYFMHPNTDSPAVANNELGTGQARSHSFEQQSLPPSHNNWNMEHVVRTAAPYLGQTVLQLTGSDTNDEGVQINDCEGRGFIYTGLNVEVDSVFEYPFEMEFNCEIATEGDPAGALFFAGVQDDGQQLFEVGTIGATYDYNGLNINRIGETTGVNSGAYIGFYVNPNDSLIYAGYCNHEADVELVSTGVKLIAGQPVKLGFKYKLVGSTSQKSLDGSQSVPGSTVPMIASRFPKHHEYSEITWYVNGELKYRTRDDLMDVWYVSQKQMPCFGAGRLTATVPLLIPYYSWSVNHLAFV